jgi:hypothetical protein
VIEQVITEWHAFLRGERPDGLDGLLDDDVTFYSPIVFTPQRGKAVTSRYLEARPRHSPGRRADRIRVG